MRIAVYLAIASIALMVTGGAAVWWGIYTLEPDYGYVGGGLIVVGFFLAFIAALGWAVLSIST